ncbi:MAG TPA: HNH endonuclease [Lelliottia sp.]|jgi:hypothetical protein
MNNNLFFPRLVRREENQYHSNRGNFYANYQDNYPKIADDCFHRCVYCDASEKECGGDPFSLDHFRPQQVFVNKFNGSLTNHPNNLYLSCQKCNVLKSNDWKGCLDTVDGATFIDKKGYIDRFKHDFYDYMNIMDTGEIESTDDNGPGNYMINKMLLNRVNRVYIRKKRIFAKQCKDVNDMITRKMDEVMEKYNSGQFNNDQLAH